MNHGYSSIFRDFNANVFAAVIFFCGALFSLLSGFVGWLGALMFGLAVIVFFAEKNPFVKRACFVVMLLCVITIVSWLLFRLILPWKFFHVLNWIIDIFVTLFLVFGGLCALNGKSVSVPFADKFIDSVCK